MCRKIFLKTKLQRAMLSTDVFFVHDDFCHWSKLFKVFSYVGLRDVRLDSCDKHAVLLLAFPGGPDGTQRLVFAPLDMLL